MDFIHFMTWYLLANHPPFLSTLPFTSPSMPLCKECYALRLISRLCALGGAGDPRIYVILAGGHNLVFYLTIRRQTPDAGKIPQWLIPPVMLVVGKLSCHITYVVRT
jgi:hypothetical protein